LGPSKRGWSGIFTGNNLEKNCSGMSKRVVEQKTKSSYCDVRELKEENRPTRKDNIRQKDLLHPFKRGGKTHAAAERSHAALQWVTGYQLFFAREGEGIGFSIGRRRSRKVAGAEKFARLSVRKKRKQKKSRERAVSRAESQYPERAIIYYAREKEGKPPNLHKEASAPSMGVRERKLQTGRRCWGTVPPGLLSSSSYSIPGKRRERGGNR